MSAEVAHHDHKDDLDHHSKEVVSQFKSGTENRSHLSMHHTSELQNGSAWHELFCVGGKIPSRRAYHLSFVWNNE
jgi:hypothetical protein